MTMRDIISGRKLPNVIWFNNSLQLSQPLPMFRPFSTYHHLVVPNTHANNLSGYNGMAIHEFSDVPSSRLYCCIGSDHVHLLSSLVTYTQSE